jgi:hypothetical protein
LTVFENRVLRRTIAPKRKKVAKGGENCSVVITIVCPVRHIY